MKHFITLFIILFSVSSFSQDIGLIVGKVLDNEMNNEPLIFANVSVKGTDLKTTSDVTGLFLLENLKDGNYTLVFTFPGYETKEMDVTVNTENPTELKLSLEAQSFSLSELASNTIEGKKSKNSTSTKLSKGLQSSRL